MILNQWEYCIKIKNNSGEMLEEKRQQRKTMKKLYSG
jgi:hypothetical protein